ncbi:pilus assembly protein [Methylobacterium sp. WL69]|uniref:TadE/TadG family type IV pilus assembly protein n=1 Tax=Methylobacterium sp. WL69 TaxID=2603893 RepID=UPI0011CCCA2B|nr:TadE/TadG family type IV pilus assembly protein [Methylobacterium sp. WL69]TXM69119.1 pilus assembly protein [Methylobacterium sp. WL69]
MEELFALSKALAKDGMARFRDAREGGVVLVFALALLPMLVLGGIVIDYGTNANVGQQAQNAVDATVLSLAKLPTATTDAVLSDKATKQVTAAMAQSQAAALTVATVRSGDTIRVTVTGTTPTSLTRLAGFTSLPLSVSGVSRRGSGNLEIALVLDNTGSMRGTKLANLKTAATDLVNSLFTEVDPAKPNALRMAVVPFSMTVNVGPGNAAASWIDKDGLASYHSQIFASKANRLALFGKAGVAWGGCVEGRPMPYDVAETAATQATPDSLFVPYFAPDESDYDSGAVNNYLNDYPFLGGVLVFDNRVRQGQVAKYGTAWRVSKTDRYNGDGYLYGPNAGCELQPITPLTNSKATLTSAVNAMTVSGDTNIPLGLVWGWHALSPIGPLVRGAAYTDATVRKFVVLMTDGQNRISNTSQITPSSNASFYSGTSYIWANRVGTVSSNLDTRTAALDGRLATLCGNMKSAGIQIFTVRVEVTDGSSDLLRSCATSPSMFFDISDSSDLTTAFRAIGAQISELRISR